MNTYESKTLLIKPFPTPLKEMTDEELVTVLTGRVERHIEVEYGKSRRYGLLDGTR